MNSSINISDRIKNEAKEIQEKFGLDFRIEKLPMVGLRPTQLVDVNGDLITGTKSVPSTYYGLFNDRTGEILTTCKEGYTVSQNNEIIELVLTAMENFGQLSVHNAGSIKGGRKVYIQLKIEGFANVGGDVIEKYVTIIDSNDGSTGLSIGIGDLTMSCQNQFFMFYKNGNAKFRHSQSLVQKMNEIPRLVTLALEESMRMIDLYKSFQSTEASKSLVHDMVNAVLGYSKNSSANVLSNKGTKSINIMDSLYDAIDLEMNGSGTYEGKGMNVWGLHSGVTRWTTHEKSTPKRDNGLFEKMTVGTGYVPNQLSLKFAKAMVGQ